MEAKLYGQNKGGMSINGIIKDYYAYAGENISAGDLVEYVNGVAGQTTGTTTETSASTKLCTWVKSGEKIDAVALDESRVFIAFHDDSTYPYLYGVVCTIEGTKITCGSITKLNSKEHCGTTFSVVLLPNGNVFIAHCYTSNYQYLAATIVSINGTKITIENFLCGMANMGMNISACLLPSGNVFITHSYTASGTAQLYGVVYKIDGTTMTFGQTLRLVDFDYAGVASSPCLLPNGNVFIAHSGYSDRCLYGLVVSISDTTITVGSVTELVNSTNAGAVISAVTLQDGRVFVVHSLGTDYTLNGIVCSISGTTITKGADRIIMSTAYAGYRISAVLVPNGSIFVAHTRTQNTNHLYGIICTINNTLVNKGTDTALKSTAQAGYAISTVLLDENVFIAHSYGTDYHLYAQMWGVDETNNIPTNTVTTIETTTEYETQVRKATTGHFDGVAKTSGTGGDNTGHNEMVSIWTLVPIVTQEITMADGNTLADANGDIFLVRGVA